MRKPEIQADASTLGAQVLLILGAPLALLSYLVYFHFPTPDEWHARRESLRVKAPHYVFLGNSVLESALDESLFTKLSGKSIINITGGGTTIRDWREWIEKALLPSGVTPENIFVGFRDTEATDPGDSQKRLWPALRTFARDELHYLTASLAFVATFNVNGIFHGVPARRMPAALEPARFPKESDLHEILKMKLPLVLIRLPRHPATPTPDLGNYLSALKQLVSYRELRNRPENFYAGDDHFTTSAKEALTREIFEVTR